MKKLLLPVFALFAIGASAQQNVIYLTSQEYQNLKQNNQLTPEAEYLFTDFQNASGTHYTKSPNRSGVCDCLVQLDSTFLLAMAPNDDYFSNLMGLPFSFDFYGTQYDSLYINNNGNISFVTPYSTFTSNQFPDATFNMIAPFWADVDTRGTDGLGLDGGNVWYKMTPSALIVVWDSVGYFNLHTDLRSTFQLIITNGADSLVPAGNNVSFCYGDMQWTTGDASSGSNGFGGAPATVGVNIGNGVDYFQVGQFDTTGTSFDGPYNSIDGVDFLDYQEIYFNIAGLNNNIPPILVSSVICDTIDVYTGDTLQKSLGTYEFTFSASTPEINQQLTSQLSCSDPAALSYSMTQLGNEFYTYTCEFNANGLSPGIYTVTAQSTDNGTPAMSSTQTIYFKVMYDESLGLQNKLKNGFAIAPNPTNGLVTITVSDAQSNATVIVHDIAGKQCSSSLFSQTTTLDLSGLTNGVYFVSIVSDGMLIGTERVVKN